MKFLLPKKNKEIIFKLLNINSGPLYDGEKPKYTITKVDDWVFNLDYAKELLTNQFGTQTLKGFGIDDMKEGVISAGCVMNYLNETQKNKA